MNLDNAKLIGNGEWVKNSRYQVYELEGKFYSVIQNDMMNLELIDETITEIPKEDIEKYVTLIMYYQEDKNAGYEGGFQGGIKTDGFSGFRN